MIRFDTDRLREILDTLSRNKSRTFLTGFANETASESPAPGGGSISAYMGALGASLATMVANLSSHKPGWDDRWEEFSQVAEKGQKLKDELLDLVDEDTNAFNKIMEALQMPKKTDAEKGGRPDKRPARAPAQWKAHCAKTKVRPGPAHKNSR